MSELGEKRAISLVKKSISHYNSKKAKQVVFDMNEEDLFIGSSFAYDLESQIKEANSTIRHKSEGFKKRFGI